MLTLSNPSLRVVFCFQVPCGMDLSYLLLSGEGEATGCHRNQPWAAFHDVSTVNICQRGRSYYGTRKALSIQFMSSVSSHDGFYVSYLSLRSFFIRSCPVRLTVRSDRRLIVNSYVWEYESLVG